MEQGFLGLNWPWSGQAREVHQVAKQLEYANCTVWPELYSLLQANAFLSVNSTNLTHLNDQMLFRAILAPS